MILPGKSIRDELGYDWALRDLGGTGPNAARYALLLTAAYFQADDGDVPTVPGVSDPWAEMVALARGDDEALSAVAQSLYTRWDDHWNEAVRMLNEIGKASPEVIEALRRKLVHKREWLRRAAVKALGKLRPIDGKSINALVTALKDPNLDVVYDAIKMLMELACWEASVLAGLVGVAQSWGFNSYVAFKALDASRSTDPMVLAAALRAQQDDDPDTSARDMAQRILLRAATITASDGGSRLANAAEVTNLDVRYPEIVTKLQSLMLNTRTKEHLLAFHSFWMLGSLRKAAIARGAELSTKGGIHQAVKYHIAALEKDFGQPLTIASKGRGRRALLLTDLGKAVAEWLSQRIE